MSKTLGQINAEAHEEESVKWDMMSDWYKSCWQAAAEAVVRETNAIQRGEREWGEPVIDDLDARMPEAVLQRAVIEAAKALNGELRMTRRYAKGEVTEAEYDVMLAVEALQALEGGE